MKLMSYHLWPSNDFKMTRKHKMAPAIKNANDPSGMNIHILYLKI